MSELKEKLIVALDVDSLEKAEGLVALLGERVKFYKIGSPLFTACGPKAVKDIAKKGVKIFLDLKYHDIPNTVYAASSAATGIIAQDKKPAVFMMTVHIKGGKEMLRQALEGARSKAGELNITRPFVIGVTRLTSEEADLEDVIDAARLAMDAGLDGVVCSAYEAKKIRREFGEKFIIVTPGIRPKGYTKHEQKRVATAREALEAGADYIVVGRPILEAKDPLKALDDLLD